MMARKRDAMGRIGAEVADLRFTPPPDLEMEGESGQAMVDWRANDDGTISIVAVEGVSIPGGEMPEREEPEEMGMEMQMEEET